MNNYIFRYGSITQSSTIRLGSGQNGEEIFVPFNSIIPMVNPDDIVIDGWDISGFNLAEAMERAQVLEPAAQQQLKSHMSKLKPKPSIYDSDFIAANQVFQINLFILLRLKFHCNLHFNVITE